LGLKEKGEGDGEKEGMESKMREQGEKMESGEKRASMLRKRRKRITELVMLLIVRRCSTAPRPLYHSQACDARDISALVIYRRGPM
jgi:hypothetical protein